MFQSAGEGTKSEAHNLMSRLPGFVGPSNVAFSRAADGEDAINVFYCVRDAGTPKVFEWYESVPGYAPFCGLSAGPIRAIYAQDFGGGNRCFAVAGDVYGEILATHTFVPIGVLALDGNPATITPNGTNGYQNFVTSGGLGYIHDLNANTFTQIVASGFPSEVVTGAFCGGFFLALQANNNVWAFSAPEDGTDWPGLNFIRISSASDDIRMIYVNQFEVWSLGQYTTQVWVLDSSSSVFGPIGGTYIDEGIIAPWSAVLADRSIFWIGGDTRGAGVVYRNQGYNPIAVSTRAIEQYFQQSARLDQTIGWTYQENGHLFVVFNVPDLDKTPVYDVTTQQWHMRALWSDRLLQWTPDVGRCHAYCFGKHLVGDRKTNTVYEMSQDIYGYDVVLT
jgi:hypothetical protein